jgi:large subunit ribosomal protein L23
MIHRFVLRDREIVISKETLYSVLKTPLITEKSTLQSEKGQYFFLVASWANKFFIKKAVETIFDVKVKNVNTSCLKGKTKRFRGREGVRQDVKKAMISLRDGQTLDLSSGVPL